MSDGPPNDRLQRIVAYAETVREVPEGREMEALGERQLDASQRRWDRLAHVRPRAGLALQRLTGISAWNAWLLIFLSLGAGWGLILALGTQPPAPQWFYVPILLAALRFGSMSAAMVGLASGLLAGPLSPSGFGTWTAQAAGDWLSQTIPFVLIGHAAGLLVGGRWTPDAPGVRRRRRESPLERQLRLSDLRRQSDELNKIQRVITESRIAIVFQPIVDLHTGIVLGVEALARFDLRPSRPPNVWFARAWRLGLGVDLELEALDAAVRYIDRLPRQLFLSVNLSPETLVSYVFGTKLAHLPLRRMVFEITEHDRVHNYGHLSTRLAALRARGARVAVDDTGAGFSSLRHILLLSPEFIKLDRTLIAGIEVDRARQALARGLSAFASGVGARVIAEGIETPQQAQVLRRLDVHCGQGFSVARPVSFDGLPPDTIERVDLPGRDPSDLTPLTNGA